MHVFQPHRGLRRAAANAARQIAHAGVAAFVAALVLTGCDGARTSLDPVFLTRQETLDLARQAQSDPQPDARRQAVIRIARSSHLTDEAVVESLANVARSDRSETVRVAAVVALGQANTVESCAYCAALLPRDDVALDRFPPEAVRGEALAALERCAAGGLLSAKLADHVAQVAVRLLQMDLARGPRLAAARVLAYFPRREVLDALIAALEQRDFAVCHAAEQSLQRLTGRSFDHNPQAWREFVAATDDPFAHPAVATDKPAGGSWFGWLSPDK